jgi:broad specificity phosphatase PhoE
LSTLIFFRHGQAGTREDYDRLSGTGREQAALLAASLRAAYPPFDAFYCGALQRQQETASAVAAAFETDPHWNEFDLDALYPALAPQIAADDGAFAAEYARLEAMVASGDQGIHRRWTSADTAVVRAWVEGRYPTPGVETWREFATRVTGARERLCSLPASSVIGISTSATPISLWIGLALELKPQSILRLAGAMYNAAITVLRLRGHEVDLVHYNAVDHLPPALRTHR